jgi:hypothetical protein
MGAFAAVRSLFFNRPRVRIGAIPLFPFLSLPFSLGPAELATHLHVMGLTGMGKSKLLAQYASQLILQGRACAVLDPHADLVEDILLLLLRQGYFRHPDAYSRLLYVDFADPVRAIPFNVLRQPHYDAYTIARNLVEACTRAWPTLSGGAAPQFENLLLAGASALIANGLPLTALPRLLTDASYRQELLRRVTDPQILDFFHARYDRAGQLNESTLRRAFLLTYPPPLRYSLGQDANRLDLRALMDRRVSLLVSLGGLDAQTQRLLGCLLTVGFEQAALSRADLPPAARTPYHLIVDEFSQFSAQSEEALERALALTRKYGLFLTLAHQTWGQAKGLQSALQNAAFLTFRVGSDDLSYAANRIGQTNPYRVKYMTGGASRPLRPVYMSAAEQREEWEYAIATLRPQEAFLRMRGRTVFFTTTRLLHPDLRQRRALREVRAEYAKQLLTPHERIADLAAGMPAPSAPPDNALALPLQDTIAGGRDSSAHAAPGGTPHPPLVQSHSRVRVSPLPRTGHDV